MTWNTTEIKQFKNVSTTQGPFTLLGGDYGITIHAGAFGSVSLQRLSADGTTFVTCVTAFTADGFQSVNLPGGTYQILVAGATGVYVDITAVITSHG